MADKLWQIEYYVDARGQSPVLEYVDTLSPSERAKLAHALMLLNQLGIRLGMPHARPIGRLWELRAGPNRFFYYALVGRRFVVLHGYRKKTQAAPRQEIAVAERRLREMLERDR